MPAAAPSITAPLQPAAPALLGTAPPSPAGPLEGTPALRRPPSSGARHGLQTMRFMRRPLPFLFRGRRELGETFAFEVAGRGEDPVFLVSHPDHVRSLFTAPIELVPSMAAESPLRPVLGPGSVLTANGPVHMRRRRLLLPPFHGDAIARYTAAIERVVTAELDRWQVGDTFATAPRMQAVTLDVIMAGILGVEGEPAPGTPELGLRNATRRLLALSERPAWQLVELMNTGRADPRGLLKLAMDHLDGHVYRVISARRAAPESNGGPDIMALLLTATDEHGARLTDRDIRDELLTLVLAGHETTANQLAWTFERLVRAPAAYDALRDAVRGGSAEEARLRIDATIHEAMRVRPVIPLVGRRVQAPWQLGEYVVPAKSIVSVAIPLLHHREDLYPDPFAFRPERFLGVKPGTYTWVPFGGGTRRCLGAALAMAEQHIVLRTVAAGVDLVAADPRAEREQHRNVTMIPRQGGVVTVTRRLI
ncbi:MAG: cytochrome [Solirubrobacterales bacterium]|nr:cytochrome [Solirubrobacterales bacterium]